MKGASAKADRATRPTDQAPTGLGDTASVPSAWQPIETAPRDGTEILLLAHGMAVQARYCAGEWSEDTPISPAEYDGAVWCAFDDAIQFEIEEGVGPEGQDWDGPVTHWMPLPKMPGGLQ